MILEHLVGPIVFAAGTIFMLLVVPRARIKELALMGLVAWLGMALVLTCPGDSPVYRGLSIPDRPAGEYQRANIG